MTDAELKGDFVNIKYASKEGKSVVVRLWVRVCR